MCEIFIRNAWKIVPVSRWLTIFSNIIPMTSAGFLWLPPKFQYEYVARHISNLGTLVTQNGSHLYSRLMWEAGEYVHGNTKYITTLLLKLILIYLVHAQGSICEMAGVRLATRLSMRGAVPPTARFRYGSTYTNRRSVYPCPCSLFQHCWEAIAWHSQPRKRCVANGQKQKCAVLQVGGSGLITRSIGLVSMTIP